MRNKLFWPILGLLVLVMLTGCAGVYDKNGDNINGRGQFRTTFINEGSVPILVEARRPHNRHMVVTPADSTWFLDKGRWNIDYQIKFWDQAAGDFIGHSEFEIEFEYCGFFNRRVTITDMTLHQSSNQEGRWGNVTGIDLWFRDNQNNGPVLVRDGTAFPQWIASGDNYYMYVKPAVAFNKHQLQPNWVRLGMPGSKEPMLIDNDRDVPWTDETTGKTIYIGWKRIVESGEIPKWWRQKSRWKRRW